MSRNRDRASKFVESRRRASRNAAAAAAVSARWSAMFPRDTDTIDEFVMTALGSFDGRSLTSIDSADLGLPGGDAETPQAPPEDQADRGFGRVVELIRAALGDRVQEVRASKRLTDSPCCLVNAEGGLSTQMQRLLRMANQDIPAPRRILELNPKHELLEKLKARFDQSADDPVLDQYAQLLFGYGLLAEGSELPEPAKFNKAVADLMTRGL